MRALVLLVVVIVSTSPHPIFADSTPNATAIATASASFETDSSAAKGQSIQKGSNASASTEKDAKSGITKSSSSSTSKNNAFKVEQDPVKVPLDIVNVMRAQEDENNIKDVGRHETTELADLNQNLEPPYSRRRRPFRRNNYNRFRHQQQQQRYNQQQQQRRHRQWNPHNEPQPSPKSSYPDPRALNSFLAAAALILQSQHSQHLKNLNSQSQTSHAGGLGSSLNRLPSSSVGKNQFPSKAAQQSFNHVPQQPFPQVSNPAQFKNEIPFEQQQKFLASPGAKPFYNSDLNSFPNSVDTNFNGNFNNGNNNNKNVQNFEDDDSAVWVPFSSTQSSIQNKPPKYSSSSNGFPSNFKNGNNNNFGYNTNYNFNNNENNKHKFSGGQFEIHTNGNNFGNYPSFQPEQQQYNQNSFFSNSNSPQNQNQNIGNSNSFFSSQQQNFEGPNRPNPFFSTQQNQNGGSNSFFSNQQQNQNSGSSNPFFVNQQSQNSGTNSFFPQQQNQNGDLNYFFSNQQQFPSSNNNNGFDYPLEIAKSHYNPISTATPPIQSQNSQQFSNGSPHKNSFGQNQGNFFPQHENNGPRPSSDDTSHHHNFPSINNGNPTARPPYSSSVVATSHAQTVTVPDSDNFHYITPTPNKPYAFTFEQPTKLYNPDVYSTNQLLSQSEQFFKQSNPFTTATKNIDGSLSGLSPEEFLKSISSPPPLGFPTNEVQLNSILNFEPYLKTGGIPPDSLFHTDLDTSKYFLPLTSTSQQGFDLEPANVHSLTQNSILEPDASAYYSPSSSSSSSSSTSFSSHQNPYQRPRPSSSPSQSSPYFDLDDHLGNPFDQIAKPSSSASDAPKEFTRQAGSASSSFNNIYGKGAYQNSNDHPSSNSNLIIADPTIYQYSTPRPKSNIGKLLSNIGDKVTKFLRSK